MIGLFYEAKKCQKADIKKIEANEITGRFCAFKNDIPLEEMNIGMVWFLGNIVTDEATQTIDDAVKRANGLK